MVWTGKWLVEGVIAVGITGLASPALGQEAGDQAIDALVAEVSTERTMATAREQIAGGDLIGGAATLERALLADANAHEVRLLYAATLCRLGDQQGARIEIGKLDRQAISDSGWDEANRACGSAFARPAPAIAASATGVSGELYFGLIHDSDARGALTLQFLFDDEPVDRDSGTSIISGIRLGYRSADYASDRGGLYASFNAVAKHDVRGPDLDYTVVEGRAGYGKGGQDINYGVGGVARYLRLLGDPYATEFGGQAELLFGAAAARRLRLRGEAVRQNYLQGFPGNGGDGMRFDLSAAIEARAGRSGIVALGLAGEVKNADQRAFAYRGGRVFAVTQMPVGVAGHYVSLSGTLRYIDFRDDRPAPDRTETRAFTRLAYGVPLAPDLVVEGAGSYTLRSANFTQTDPFFPIADPATYRSIGAEARLIAKF